MDVGKNFAGGKDPRYLPVAGFWPRFCAFILDMVLLVAGAVLLDALIAASFWELSLYSSVSHLHRELLAALTLRAGLSLEYATFIGGLSVLLLISFTALVALGPIYFTLLECSPLKASFGKCLTGLEVCNDQGLPLGFAQALLRNFVKIISAVPLLLGFIAALFSPAQRALHDTASETWVIESDGYSENRVTLVSILVLLAFVISGLQTVNPEITKKWLNELYRKPQTLLSTKKTSLPKKEVSGSALIGSEHLRFDGVTARLRKDYAVHLDLALFPAPSGTAAQTLSDEAISLRTIQKQLALERSLPMLLVSFQFDLDADECDLRQLRGLSLHFSRGGALRLPEDLQMLDIIYKSFNLGSHGLLGLSCDLRNGGELRVKARYEDEVELKSGAIANLAWDFKVNTSIGSAPAKKADRAKPDSEGSEANTAASPTP